MPAMPGKRCVAVRRFGLVMLRVAVGGGGGPGGEVEDPDAGILTGRRPQLGTALASSAVTAILAVRTVWT
jgi:hypothetical protein